jgi:toxin HigB-1
LQQLIRFPYYGKQYRIAAVIRSFRCRLTQQLANDVDVRQFRAFERVARRKLELLASATRLHDLRFPQGNRLEALKGDREGQHSIRINDQWRICFRWNNGDATDVEIVDYH